MSGWELMFFGAGLTVGSFIGAMVIVLYVLASLCLRRKGKL
jgi:hypothetical protein